MEEWYIIIIWRLFIFENILSNYKDISILFFYIVGFFLSDLVFNDTIYKICDEEITIIGGLEEWWFIFGVYLDGWQ